MLPGESTNVFSGQFGMADKALATGVQTFAFSNLLLFGRAAYSASVKLTDHHNAAVSHLRWRARANTAPGSV
jgi:hypothetical protein